MKVRGYIFSRPFMGERVPQHIQNQIIRKFCETNRLEYSLSASEYAMKNSYLMLEEIINEKSSMNGIVFYSLFQLPENKIYRNNIYKNIIKRKKKIFFSVENFKLSSKNDILELEEIWDVKSVLPNCYKGY
tara:strand:- start:490 stop:882 length:393 start_codon:yes stop_codon:yes gene_type:complete